MASGVQLSTYCSQHQCDVCHTQVWSIGVPRGWFQIRRGRDPGQTHVGLGLFCKAACLAVRSATYFDTEQKANGMPYLLARAGVPGPRVAFRDKRLLKTLVDALQSLESVTAGGMRTWPR